MSRPVVSVLLPSLNQAEFLPAAIESVLRQDFRDFEFVIADAGSRDESRTIIARYAARDERIRVCPPDTDPGLAGNWNHCLAQARGAFIKFMFGDDCFVSPTALGRLLDAFKTHPSVVLASSQAQILDARSQVCGVRDGRRREGVHRGLPLALNCVQRLSNFVGEPPLVMFRAQPGLAFNPAYRHLVDLECWLRLLAGGDFYFVAHPLTAFRRHVAQLSARNLATGQDLVEARWLVRDALRHPVLGASFTERHLFRTLYTLRKQPLPGGAADEIEAELLRRLGTGRYRVLWLRHKLLRPLEQLSSRWRRT